MRRGWMFALGCVLVVSSAQSQEPFFKSPLTTEEMRGRQALVETTNRIELLRVRVERGRR